MPAMRCVSSRFHYMDAYSVSYEMNQYFSMRGCVVLSVEYRSSIMRGYAFRNAPGWGNAGASEYKDVLGAAEYLKSRPDFHVAKSAYTVFPGAVI
jgi:dipeptidyl aminopeptidase/acylaminoacyl peptidase